MTRTDPDSCPGVLRLHQAADGPLARIRVPGGHLTPGQLQALAEAARDLGDGNIELTSRGNIQLRQVHDAAALEARLTAAGLLPSATHERVRNIIASPLSGRVGGWTDVHTLVPDLDRRLQADPNLALLPGRVLFTLDDGRGDVSGLGGDIGIHALDENTYALLLAGDDTGLRVPPHEAVDLMLRAAHAFLELRDGHWRVHEVPDGRARITSHLRTAGTDLGSDSTAPADGTAPETSSQAPSAPNDEEPAAPHAADPSSIGDLVNPSAHQDIPIGWLTQADGRVTLGAGVRLGSLPARTAEFIAAIERPVYVTPWRSLVITDLDEWAAEQVVRVLAPMGLIFDANSPWLEVSACAGQPGCAKSHTDVRADVTAAVESGRVVHENPDAPRQSDADGLDADEVVAAGRQHWSGCDRRCGRPRGEVTDIVATPDGYRITPAG
ncbi:precorrin-3B synthase [Nocardia yamanashiensis]|uniref:precorrin-3B synthase n=1 Tax=Nocardia yamanashiensis TaxID=209247 RepID=UPI001E593045|nr:precorrin-3B synthase [Nocardia yamanashiensis]UGT44259.1 precorrin-3B synthase [Nocardia yamanashiensis]